MKKTCKKLLLLFLCTFLLLQGLTLGVFAVPEGNASDTDPYTDGNGWVIWSYNAATDTVRGLGKEYTLYTPTMNLIFDAETTYCFENEISHPQEGYAELFAYDRDPEILQLGNYLQLIYVTERGRISLQALEEGNAASYAVTDGVHYADFDAETLQSMKNGTEKETFDVNRLESCYAYDILGIDGTGAYFCVYGSVYQIDDAYYYVHVLDLDNRYFDADGNFSYRKGTVEAVKLDAEQTAAVQRGSLGEYKEYDWIYESDALSYSGDESGAIALFVICAVLLGFILPMPFLIVSLCMANSKLRGKPKYWYVLTAVSVAWMLTALFLLIVLL